MAVFRIEKTRDYTVMSNHHLRDTGLSLKFKGLLSMMLSLPEDWNYTTRGLAKICKEGTDSIRQTDTICLRGAGRPVRHDPVASPQDGTPTKQESDEHQAAKQVWQPVGEDAQTR